MPRLPLDGVRVIDLTWIIARPTATHFLADFGADVIKVEHEQAVHKAHTIQMPYTANVKVRTKVLDFV